MATPCEQQSNILNIAKTLERMEDGQRSIVKLLQKVAAQDARIEHLEEHDENRYNDIADILTRIRALELKDASHEPEVKLKINEVLEEATTKIDQMNQRLETLLSFYRITTHPYAVWIYATVSFMILFSFSCSAYDHFEFVQILYKFFKG